MPMRTMLTTLPAVHAEISLAASRRILKAPTFLNAPAASLFLQWFFYSSLNNIKIQFSNLRRRYITPFPPVTTNIETTYQNIPSKIICTCSCIRQLTNHFLFVFLCAVASWLVRSSPNRAVWFRALGSVSRKFRKVFAPGKP